MNKTFTATEARRDFYTLLKLAQKPGASVTITHEGHPKVVMMSVEEFEGWMETLDILSNPGEAADLREAIADAKSGKEKGIPWEEFKKSLAL